MATYGMKDAANVTLVDKRTKEVSLFIDYANATSSEWTSERVYATKKGTNAIAWDSNRTGTLTIDSEIFDLSYLALVIGSDIANGREDIMKREAVTLDETKKVELKGSIEPESVSVIKLKEDMIEHDGVPVPSTTGQHKLLPEIVGNFTVAFSDSTAVLNFSPADRAVTYAVVQDGVVVHDDIIETTFTVDGLTPEKDYTFEVYALNEYGQGATSAPINVKMAGAGNSDLGSPVAPEEGAELEAQAKDGKLNYVALNMVTFNVVGNVVEFSDKALACENYAIYYLEEVDNVRTITVSAD